MCIRMRILLRPNSEHMNGLEKEEERGIRKMEDGRMLEQTLCLACIRME